MNNYKIQLRDYLKRHDYARSNTEAKRLIRAKQVLVNGIVAKSCSIKVASELSGAIQVVGDKNGVDIDDCHSGCPSHDLYSPFPFCLVYHKPCGMICSLAPQENGIASALTLGDIDPPLPDGFHPVGRLDQHSHGLLLFSSDGRLTSALLSSSSSSKDSNTSSSGGAVERVYEIVARRRKNDDDKHDGSSDTSAWHGDIRRKVHEGVSTDYGFLQGEIGSIRDDAPHDYEHSFCGTGCGGERNDAFGQRRNNTNVHDNSIDENNIYSYTLSSITVTVREGKKRMIRRLFAALGLFVVDLKRVRYGNIQLGDCPKGQWRYLSRDEQDNASELIRGRDMNLVEDGN